MGQVLLVRHGQASWGAEDYDVLSEVGHQQSRLLGEALAARGVVPDRVLHGDMRRHRETAEDCIEAAGWDVPVVEDDGWDEFDHLHMLSVVPAPFEGRQPNRTEFQHWFETATDRWTAGEHDSDYHETFADFTARVEDAVRRATEADARTVIVFSSGGPVSWAAASLLGDSTEVSGALWRKLNPVCVNSGVTRVVTGRRGTTLVTFNEHAHLDATPDLLTYR